MINSEKKENTRSVMIQSNSIRGSYKDSIVDRTMEEIHDAMRTVFGPYATDAWITKNGNPYYTRDGKEVFASIQTDNELSEYIRKVMYQAVENQARKVGDGTTTLLIFYTNLYKRFRGMVNDFSMTDGAYDGSITSLRTKYNDIITNLVSCLNDRSQKITDEYLKSMIYTCTQDAELTEQLYVKLHDAMMEQAYIIPQQSSVETDLDVDVHDRPMIKATKLYESSSTADGIIDNASVMFVNGALDISDIDTILTLGAIRLKDNACTEVSPTICILCSGVTESTRRVLKEYNNLGAEGGNKIFIFSIDGFRGYTTEEIDDIISYIYDREESSGLDNHLTFEAHLYQAFVKPVSVTDKEIIWKNPTLGKYDTDIQNITTLRNTLLNVQKLEYRSGDGIRFYKEPGELSKKKYEDLLNQMSIENSPTKRIEIKNRIKKLYGRFIEVNVGSKLLKDGQRRFEIVLDAIISSNEAVEHGVLTTNSIYVLTDILMNILNSFSPVADLSDRRLLMSLYEAVIDTMIDIIQNKYPNIECNNIKKKIEESLKNKNSSDGDNNGSIAFNLMKDYEDIFNPDDAYKIISAPDGMDINTMIVEPVSIMTTLLKNSTLVLELAMTKMFNLNGYMYNYI